MCRVPLRVVTVYQHSISHTPVSVGGPRSTVALCHATCSYRWWRHTDDCCLDVIETSWLWFVVKQPLELKLYPRIIQLNFLLRLRPCEHRLARTSGDTWGRHRCDSETSASCRQMCGVIKWETSCLAPQNCVHTNVRVESVHLIPSLPAMQRAACC